MGHNDGIVFRMRNERFDELGECTGCFDKIEEGLEGAASGEIWGHATVGGTGGGRKGRGGAAGSLRLKWKYEFLFWKFCEGKRKQDIERS